MIIETKSAILKNGTLTVNGTTNHGSLASAPTALAGGDQYYNSTDNIPYVWNGAEWLQVTAGSAFGQLDVEDNATGQTGISTTYQKITQYNANGIEEGGVAVSIPSSQITIPAGTWEISYSQSFTTDTSNRVAHFSIFDVADTGFLSPLLTRERKVGTSSDIGSTAGSKYVTFASPTTIALFVKVDAGPIEVIIKHGSLSVIRIK